MSPNPPEHKEFFDINDLGEGWLGNLDSNQD